MKKIFITIIAMLLPLMASADVVVVEVNGINYNLNSLTKEATVAQGKYSGDINILPQVTYKGVTYTVTKINGQNFYCCGNLTSVIIPNTVTYIGMEAFRRCSSLASVTIPSSVTHIDEGAFDGCSNLSIYITDLEAWCKMYINPAAFSDGVGGEQIYYRLFVNGKEIKDLVIPSGMTSINSSVFSNCSSLTSVSIPNSATSIGDFAFSRCSNLTSVIIPNSVTSIGVWAFYNCRSLTSVTIPNSVTSIGSSAFSGCTSLAPVNIPASVQTIRDGAFSECTSLTSITIPNSVTTIGGSAFSRCSGLTSITIPNSVTSIGYSAFYGTGWYNNQPDGLVYAGKIAYRYKGAMPNNTSITIKDGTLGIAESAFSYCSGLTYIEIPNSVTSIGSSAFSYCSGLTSVTIPNSVTNIGESAFSGCSGLTSIVSLNNTPPTCEIFLGNNTQFNSVDKSNCIVWVPRGSANVYKEADGWKDFNNIRELAYGDVNIDFEVNQADLDATTNFIVGKDSEGFYESQADLNGDDEVDAADVVKLVTILNIQEGLNMDWQANFGGQVISSLSCTLNNDGDKAIQLTKCELYFNDKLVSSSKFKVTLSTGGSKKCSFDDLASLSSKTGFSLVWYYTYNGEDYTYRCDLTE